MIARFLPYSRSNCLPCTCPPETGFLPLKSKFANHYSDSIFQMRQNQIGCLSFPKDVGNQTFTAAPFCEGANPQIVFMIIMIDVRLFCRLMLQILWSPEVFEYQLVNSLKRITYLADAITHETIRSKDPILVPYYS